MWSGLYTRIDSVQATRSINWCLFTHIGNVRCPLLTRNDSFPFILVTMMFFILDMHLAETVMSLQTYYTIPIKSTLFAVRMCHVGSYRRAFSDWGVKIWVTEKVSSAWTFHVFRDAHRTSASQRWIAQHIDLGETQNLRLKTLGGAVILRGVKFLQVRPKGQGKSKSYFESQVIVQSLLYKSWIGKQSVTSFQSSWFSRITDF